MNDTETEARRLLAAATEDMPPGTDLLGGFAAARRRDRTRRTRRRVVLSAGAAVAAVAMAIVLTIGSARPALATLTNALTRTLTASYHLTEQYRNATGRTTLTCTTKADPRRHLEADFCPDGSGRREVGRYTYIRFPQMVGHPGKHWERISACGGKPVTKRSAAKPLNPVTGTIGGFVLATPRQMLSDIKKAATVTVVGPTSGRGWTGTRYAYRMRLRAGMRISGTVDVDQQGRARNLILTFTGPGSSGPGLPDKWTQALTFSDFGAPVTVTPPPADQTVVLHTHC